MADNAETPVLVQPRGRLLSLVLNRPRVLNALSLDLIRELRRLLEEAKQDDGVRLVVLSGAGERGFCAGGDLKELLWAVQAGVYHLTDEFFREEYALDLLIHQFSKPVVALALHQDRRFSSSGHMKALFLLTAHCLLAQKMSCGSSTPPMKAIGVSTVSPRRTS